MPYSNFCEGDNCKFFDPSMKNIAFSGTNLPIIDKFDSPLFPFYHSAKQNSEFKIQVENLPPDRDACFRVSYFTNSHANLGFNYGNSSKMYFSPHQITNGDEWYKSGEICSRSLMANFQKSFEISLSSSISNPSKDIVAFRFENYDQIGNFVYVKEDLKSQNELRYLTFWNHLDDSEKKEYDKKNQWVFMMPDSPHWLLGDDNSITFSNSKYFLNHF